jgi:hypothetical protein
MQKLVSYCGIICSDCGAFLATKNDDNNLRQKTAEEWSKQFGHKMKPEDINCKGCTSGDDTTFNYCTVCEIRQCGKAKKVKNCAYCADYAYEKLEKFFQMAPACKTTLDGIKQTR